MLGRAFQDLNRLRQISSAMVRHGFGAYVERMRLRDVLGRDAPPPGEPLPPPDRKTAARFRTMLGELGPTFIKLGQLLSSRPDVLPAHWIEELEALQDDCPPVPISEVRREIERGLGRSVEAVFAELDPVPLASASIAQVHRAVTHAGEAVVVKVQRPRIREQVESDLALLYDLARLLEAVVEETGVYTPTGVIEEFDRTVHEELDFTNEARNAQAMAAKSTGREFLVVPRVHAGLSSSTILTLDYVEGVKVSDVTAEAGFDLEQVARNIIEAAFRQLFEDGLFHGDPHPGNILVLPGNRIALLDFGLVGRLTRAQQEALVTLIVAVALRDPESVARILNRIGVPDSHTPIAEFREDIRGILDRYLGLKLDEIRTATLLRDLLDLAVRHRIRIPKEYAVLAKASIAVEGIIRRLYPKLDILDVGLPYAKELLLSRFNPSDASGVLMKSFLKLQALSEDVPAQLSQILVDLEGGKFRVNVHSDAIDRLGGHVRSLGVMIFLGLLAAGFTVSAFVVLATGGRPVLWIGALAVAALLSGAAALYHVATLRLRKISVRRFLQR
ncbi:ABC1 kinase family protein [Anaeromyxobacter oryzae]|uniref:ABC transporter n=1 Tax=Anaeromyxobacter oryzae TaxID=2918170 RepID=A0ABN6N3F9_9BACT|nr:AarF/ABC1/UbiB kinase family protein [Anaeromyxobacter oryzae]BDG06570.1 ABC transporter [Anaeromyxobacter oryzae]